MHKYGLLGRNISYSFSRTHFTDKFSRENIMAEYVNFDIPDLSHFPGILQDNKDLGGLNVTIPYKQDIFPYLDKLSPIAREIGAVNTIKFTQEGLIGHNTDYYGFSESIRPFLKQHHKQALILGTGGASKAVQYALESINIKTVKVSRSSGPGVITYEDLDPATLETHQIIINCTPLGTHPNITELPPIQTQYLSSQHLIYDLIYNPAQTALMQKAAEKGAQVSNGYQMLLLQAEEAWRIWNNKSEIHK